MYFTAFIIIAAVYRMCAIKPVLDAGHGLQTRAPRSVRELLVDRTVVLIALTVSIGMAGYLVPYSYIVSCDAHRDL